MESFEHRRVSPAGRLTLPASTRRRWGIGHGGEVEVLDLEGAVLVVPKGGKGRLLDQLYPVEAHYAFVDQDDDPDLQTT